MARLNYFAIGSAAIAALAATAVRASPSGTITITASTPTALEGQTVGFHVSYSVSDLGADNAHVEVDFCTPAESVQTSSDAVQGNLPTCVDGFGNQGTQFKSLEISGGGSAGVNGNFDFQTSSSEGFLPSGTTLTVPARIVLDSATPQILATSSAVVTLTAAPHPSFTKSFYSATLATRPGGTDSGTNVTWRITLANDSYNGNVLGTYFVQGTSTITDPISAGAVYVGGVYSVQTDFSGLSPIEASLHLNSNPTITAADPSATSVVMTLDNLLSYTTIITPTFLVTIWYPDGSTLVTNTATSSFGDGTNSDATGSVYLGSLNGVITKFHRCLDFDYTTATALQPLPTSNFNCAFDPSAAVEFDIELGATSIQDGSQQPMLNPVITDVLPSNMVLLAVEPVWVGGTDTNAPGWALSVSSDSNCDSANGSFTAIAAGNSAALAGARCVRASYSGGFTNPVSWSYTAGLDSVSSGALNSAYNSFAFVDNTAYANATDFIATAQFMLTTTFWNSHLPQLDFASPSEVGVGQTVFVEGVVPFDFSQLIGSFQGFTDLTWTGTLPIDLDLTGAPIIEQAPYPPSPSVTPLPVNCTFTPQNRTNLASIIPATYSCTVPGYMPSYRISPFDPSMSSSCFAPFFCEADADNYPWNTIIFRLPVKILSGTAGQDITVPNQVWSNEGDLGTGGVVPPGSGPSNPVTANYDIFIGGTPQLTVHKSTPSISVATNQTINYFIDYSNSGTSTTTNTYVYDLFNLNPVTNNTLSVDYGASHNCTATDAPVLVAVSHVSGAPASTISYTTTPNPTVASATWTTTPPPLLNTVTGVRWLLNSAFQNTPGAYSPTDQAGREELTFSPPQQAGSTLCNFAAIVADGFQIAGAIAAGNAIPITPDCTTPGGCDPVPSFPINPSYPVGDLCGDPTIALDGSGSTNAVSYAWTLGNSTTPFATTAVASIPLPRGTYSITLTVTNSFGVSASETQSVSVVDTTPPVIACPAGVTATVNHNCVPSYTVSATATDLCDGTAPVTCDAPVLGVGEDATTATCTATNSEGLTDTCSIPITVDTSGCACGASFTMNGTTLETPEASDGTSFCAATTLYFVATITPPCGQSNDEVNTSFSVSYVNSAGQTKTQLIPAFEAFWDIYSDPSGLTVDLPVNALPQDVSGLTSFTFTAFDINGAPIGSATTAPVFITQDSTLCDFTECVPDGMVFFEDRWPANGDLDFNDQTVTYNYQFLIDPDGTIPMMLAQFNILSVGATIHNGVYLHIPNMPWNVDVTISAIDSDGNNYPVSKVDGEDDLVIQLAGDTRDLFPSSASPAFINTDPRLPGSVGRAIALTVVFNDPLDYQIETEQAPFDIFIAQSGSYGHQIHMTAYPGTTLADDSLNGGPNDGSLPDEGLFYVNAQGLPFALNVPVLTVWPKETVSIENVFPGIVDFAADNLQDPFNNNAAFWYDPTTAVMSNAYTADKNGVAAPQPNLFAPPLLGIGGLSCTAPPFSPPGQDDDRGAHHGGK